MLEYGEMKARIPTSDGKISASLYRDGNEIYGSLADGGTVRIIPALGEKGETRGWKVSELRRGD